MRKVVANTSFILYYYIKEGFKRNPLLYKVPKMKKLFNSLVTFGVSLL